MRIAIVSAHYPPNFVSGGTLVPARIARTLADRGHQVYVFAGEVLEGEPDLMVRVEDARDEALAKWRAKARTAYGPAELADYRLLYELLDQAIRVAHRVQ